MLTSVSRYFNYFLTRQWNALNWYFTCSPSDDDEDDFSFHLMTGYHYSSAWDFFRNGSLNIRLACEVEVSRRKWGTMIRFSNQTTAVMHCVVAQGIKWLSCLWKLLTFQLKRNKQCWTLADWVTARARSSITRQFSDEAKIKLIGKSEIDSRFLTGTGSQLKSGFTILLSNLTISFRLSRSKIAIPKNPNLRLNRTLQFQET